MLLFTCARNGSAHLMSSLPQIVVRNYDAHHVLWVSFSLDATLNIWMAAIYPVVVRAGVRSTGRRGWRVIVSALCGCTPRSDCIGSPVARLYNASGQESASLGQMIVPASGSRVG